MKHRNYIKFAIFVAALLAGASSLHAQWSADSKISVADTNAALSENADICLAASGDSVHVVWWDTKKDSGAIYYRHSYDGGMTWAAPIRITPFLKSVDFPSVAISGSMVHVAWRNNTDSGSYYIHSADGGNTWGNSVSLGVYYFWPSVASSGSNVFMTFNSSIPGNSEVYLRRSTDNGTTWIPVFQISNALGRSEDQSISASGKNIDMVWNDNRTGIMQAFYRRSRDNGVTWGPETQLSNALKFSYFPMVNATGQYVDVVRGDRDANNNFQIMYTRSNDSGSTWSTEVSLSNNSTGSAYPVIKRDGQNVHVVWWNFNGSINYRSSIDGGITWGPIQSLVDAANKPAKPFIEISGPVLHVIWLDAREGHPEVYYKRNPTGNPITNFIVPNSADFGNIKIGTSKDTTLMLRNLGTMKVNIVKYSLFDPSNGFMLLDTSVHSINAHDSAAIKVHFNPLKVQSYSGIITITTDESSSNSHGILLSGAGVDGRFSAPANIDFGDVKVGGMRDTTITLQNSGAAKMNISGYFLTDQSNGFVLVDTSAHGIAANGNVQIKIRFNAVKEQSYAGTITITTDESALSSHRITLSGRGVNSKLVLSPSPLNFGNVDSAKTLQKILTITNTGTSAAMIDSLRISGSNMFVLDSPLIAFSIPAGGKNSIWISFNPVAAGAVNATLLIGAAEGTQPQVLLTGNGVGKKDTVQHSSVRMANSILSLLEVTPNPASTNATLKIGAAKQLEDVKIHFYDIAGKLLSIQNIGALNEGMNTVSLQLPHESGALFIRISSGGNLIGTAEIIIMR